MSDKRTNNIRADQIADQLCAARRDGSEIPGTSDDVIAALVRTCDLNKVPPHMQDAVQWLVESFADELNIDVGENAK